MRRRERGAGGTGRASRGRAASAAAAAPEPRAASGRAGPAGRTGTGEPGGAGGESRGHCPALGPAGSAARPVPAALRARFPAGRWEGPGEPRRPGQSAAPGSAAAAPGVPCGTAGQPQGKGTAGAALPVRQRPGPRALGTSSPRNDQRKSANGSARSERQRPRRSEPAGGAAPLPARARPGRGRSGDHRSLFRARPHGGAGAAEPALPGAASRGPARGLFLQLLFLSGAPIGAPLGLGSGGCAQSLLSLQAAPQTANAARALCSVG